VSFLIDTDILSLLERKRVPEKLSGWVKAHEDEIFLSVVSIAELDFGARNAPSTHRPLLTEWISGIRMEFSSAIEPLSEAVLSRWKELLWELKSKKRTMTCEDSLIAATALFHGHTLVTRNKRHFEPAGVTLFDPLG
jgi:toxin FitB